MRGFAARRFAAGPHPEPEGVRSASLFFDRRQAVAKVGGDTVALRPYLVRRRRRARCQRRELRAGAGELIRRSSQIGQKIANRKEHFVERDREFAQVGIRRLDVFGKVAVRDFAHAGRAGRQVRSAAAPPPRSPRTPLGRGRGAPANPARCRCVRDGFDGSGRSEERNARGHAGDEQEERPRHRVGGAHVDPRVVQHRRRNDGHRDAGGKAQDRGRDRRDGHEQRLDRKARAEPRQRAPETGDGGDQRDANRTRPLLPDARKRVQHVGMDRRLLTRAANAPVAHFAVMRRLAVHFEDRIGIIHRAFGVETVFQSEGVAELVHALGQRSLEQQIRVGLGAVKLGAQAMERDGGDALLLVGIAVDEPMRRLVEVERGDREQRALTLGVTAQRPREQRRQEELVARRVERASRNRERAFDAHRREIAFFETETEPIKKRALDDVDRDYANLRLHLGARSSPPVAGKLVGASEAADMIVGIGMDLAEVERYRFDDRALAWFARKIYTEDEMRYARSKRNWPERLAGFFAAKEATRKAFGHAIPWRWVGVTHERSGKPGIALLGKAERLLALREIETIHLTITHTASTAAAVVILER